MALDPPVVVSLGDNCLDVYLSPVDRVLVGGSCLNVAVGVARRGLSTAYVGAVGADEQGRLVLDELAAQGVDPGHVRTVEGATTAVTEIALELDGERRFLTESYAIHETYDPSEQDWLFAESADHVHASRVPRHFDRLRSLSRPAGVSVSYDFSAGHIPPQLDGLAIAFIPGELLPAGADPAASACELVDRGCSCAVVTLGSKGSVAATADEEEGVSAAPLASVLDTCGAGDAFIAAFIVGRLAGRTLRECLAVGAEAGAEACSIVGAFPQRGAQTLVEQ